jgi:Tfp pilus assembly protein PilN
MTMIRINLIAEKKTGAPKAAKKSTGQTSEIQENLIIILSVLLAVLVFFLMRSLVKNELAQKVAQEQKLQAEYDKVKHWKDKKLEYEVHRELLNEKIQRISELRDQRQGPVKLMQDIANVLPESVWLQSIEQGYQGSLVRQSGKGREALKLKGNNLETIYTVKLSGRASSTEAITNFANRMIQMDASYQKVDLNTVRRTTVDGPQEYDFSLFFAIRPPKKSNAENGDVANQEKKGG